MKKSKECGKSKIKTLVSIKNQKRKNISDEYLCISEANKGNKYAAGIKHTDEWKATKSILMSGDRNHFYGRHHSDDTKKKISNANKKIA